MQIYSGTKRINQKLKKSAVPSVFSWTCPVTLLKSKERRDRYSERTESRKKKLFQDLINITSTERDPEPEFIAQKLDMVCDDLEVGACEEVVPDKNCFSAALFSKQLSIPSSGS